MTISDVESLRARKAYPARSTETILKYAEENYLDWGQSNFFLKCFEIYQSKR